MDHRKLFSQLRAVRKKKLKAKHHLQNYSNYLTANKVPSGLKSKITPLSTGPKSNNFNRRWQTIISGSQKKMLELLKSQTQHELAKLDKRELHCHKALSSACSDEQLREYSSKLDSFSQSLQKELDEKQAHKFDRDGINPTGTNITEPTVTKRPRNRRFRRKKAKADASIRNVVNLSSYQLSDTDVKLLSKGLNFCPRPKTCNAFEMEKDFKDFARRMRLKQHFFNKDEVGLKFRPKSHFTPPPGDAALESFLTAIKGDILQHRPSNHKKDNLTPAERQSLSNLRNNNDIVIKPADKGSSVVVQNKTDYIAEAQRQLSDDRFYRELDSDPTEEHAETVRKTLYEMHEPKHIDDKALEYLLPEYPKPGRFYLLPKIHKEGNPGRPIISANDHPTEKISEYVDFHLRPFVKELPSYIQDTTDYINKTPSENLPDNTILVTMDVCSLYTNIPHVEGMEACREAWDRRTIKRPPTKYLMKLLEHILKLNNFVFNKKHYLQINGTAMGTKMAPSYANIFMGRLETRLLIQAPVKPLSWLRFIDDVEMKWANTRESLEQFIETANNFHPSIKFTVDISDNSNIFLDTTSILEDDKIKTDIYCKPVDTHQYLLPSSSHPRHVIKNLPKGLSLRVKRICSDNETCDKRLNELRGHLRARGYEDQKIDTAFAKSRAANRDTLLQYKPKEKNKRVPFVMTYHPDGPNLHTIVHKRMDILHSSDLMREIFPEAPIIAYRRPKNLKDHLVRARVDSNRSNNTGVVKCKARRCELCKLMPETDTFRSSRTGISYKIFQKMSCNSKNVIYLITCKTCQIQYVGETVNFRLRMNNHKSAIRNNHNNSVARHFNSLGHSIDSLELLPIESNPGWSEVERLDREKYWMHQLSTLPGAGLNERVN